MMTLTIGSWVTNLLTVLFALVSGFMVLVILIQKPKGGGLSGAFGGGGGGGGGAVFGAKAGDVLTWFTVVGFVVFLLLGMGLVWSTRSDANPTLTPTTETSTDTALPPALGGDSPGEAIIEDEDQLIGDPAPDPPPAPPVAEDPIPEAAEEPAGEPEPTPDEPNDAEPNP